MSRSTDSSFTDDRDLYSGLIRLHVLHHAVEEPIFGLGMLEELARHGYRISPGTLYPILHGLEKRGYLRSTTQRNGKSLRKVYRATAAGRDALESAKSKVRELFAELIEGGEGDEVLTPVASHPSPVAPRRSAHPLKLRACVTIFPKCRQDSAIEIFVTPD